MAAVTAAVVGGSIAAGGIAESANASSRARKAAKKIYTGEFGTGSNPFGGGTFDRNYNLNMDLGSFGGLFGDLQGGLESGEFSELGRAGLGSFLEQGSNIFGQMGGDEFGIDQGMLDALRQNSFDQFGVLGQSAQELGADQLDIMRQIAAPMEQRARVGQQDNLFAMGQMGTTGGALQTEALMKAQADADLKRQLAANQFGMDVRSQAQNQLFGNLQQMGSLQNDAFGRAANRFGIAQNLFDATRQTGLDRMNIFQSGLGSLGAIQGFGLNNFNSALNALMARNNAQIGKAGATIDAAGMQNNFGLGLMNLGGSIMGMGG